GDSEPCSSCLRTSEVLLNQVSNLREGGARVIPRSQCPLPGAGVLTYHARSHLHLQWEGTCRHLGVVVPTLVPSPHAEGPPVPLHGPLADGEVRQDTQAAIGGATTQAALPLQVLAGSQGVNPLLLPVGVHLLSHGEFLSLVLYVWLTLTVRVSRLQGPSACISSPAPRDSVGTVGRCRQPRRSSLARS